MGNALEIIKRKGRKNTMKNRIYDEKTVSGMQSKAGITAQSLYYLPKKKVLHMEIVALEYIRKYKREIHFNLLTRDGLVSDYLVEMMNR